MFPCSALTGAAFISDPPYHLSEQLMLTCRQTLTHHWRLHLRPQDYVLLMEHICALPLNAAREESAAPWKLCRNLHLKFKQPV